MALPVERRKRLLGLAHKAAQQLGMDDELRRMAQQAFCGKQSLKDFTDQELISWCWELKRRGADIGIPAPPPKGGVGWERPTPAQWATIERLASRIGLDDVGLRAFCARTCHLDDPRFLTKRQASHLITGLSRWAESLGVETASKTKQAIAILLEGE